MFGSVGFGKMAGRQIGKVFGVGGKEKIEKEIADQGLSKEGLELDVDDKGKVTVSGEAMSQEMKEKVILAVGNVFGVGEVDDKSKDKGKASQFHTVVSGDTLWKISKKYYGKGSRYPEIFEANRPMLTHPDKIYVGQVLRIPAESSEMA